MHKMLRDGLGVNEALQDAASTEAYGQSCEHEGPKMQGNSSEVGRRPAAIQQVVNIKIIEFGLPLSTEVCSAQIIIFVEYNCCYSV